jgi:hypothetical protein
VIFAWGDNDPEEGKDISYHFFNRGSKKLNLISSVEARQDPREEMIQIIDLKISNVRILFGIFMIVNVNCI